LGAEDPGARVDADRLAGRGHAPLQLAARRHHRYVEHQVLDVAVAVLLHAAGAGGDPAAQGRELDAVRLVAEGESLAGQRLGAVAAHGPGLDAGAAVDGIDPADAVHPPGVHGDDRPRLVLGTAQRLR